MNVRSIGNANTFRAKVYNISCRLFILYSLNISYQVQAMPAIKYDPSGHKSGFMGASMENNDAKKIGQEMRFAIDQEFLRLVELKELKRAGHGSNDISSVVLRYIPIGTSSSDGETIMSAAGFKVWPRGPKSWDANNYDVIGTIQPYKSTQLYTAFSVSIELQIDGKNYSKITGVIAGFSQSTL